MSDINTIREKAKAAVAERLAKVKEDAEIALLTNEKFQDAMVVQALREETTATLASLSAQCEAVVVNNPIFSTALKQNRTWNPSRRYGFGNQFAALTGLLSGIQYSAADHNAMMLIITGLNTDIIERTLDAAGTLPYYNPRHNIIVDGKPANIGELIECIQLLELSLGVNIDKTALTQPIANRQYEIALAKAQQAHAEAALALQIQDFVIQ